MFTISPSDEDLRRGLESWEWVGVSGLTPILVSCFGDIFFESSTGIQFLDTIEGIIRPVCSARDALDELLSTEEAQDEFLLGGLVMGLEQQRLCLSPGECYDFKVPPILGGAVGIENVHITSFVVKLHIAGQLHEQVKHLPEGTQITGFTLQDS